MRRCCLIAGFLVWITFGSRHSEAQYTADFQTNVISGTTSNWSGDYIVADTTSFDVLLVESGGVLLSGEGILANVATSSNNAVIVSGVSSRWINQDNLLVGQFGSGNSLLIEGGGVVANVSAAVGNQFGSTNNIAVVTGGGSVWSNQFALNIGGVGNSLVISNGGAVIDSSVQVGSVGSNNWVFVTGIGSLWKMGLTLNVGFGESSSNHVVVSNGGSLISSYCQLGYGDLSHDNTMLITDSGSTWSNEIDLTVGSYGHNNRLVISNGAVVVTYLGELGGGADKASNNVVIVTGNGSAWNMRSSLIVGERGSHNTLAVLDGALVVAGDAVVGSGVNSASNSVTIADASLTVSNAPGTFNLSHGTLFLSNGVVNAPIMLVDASGMMDGSGLVRGDLTNAGTLNPGMLTVTGNVTMTANALTRIELAGTNTSEFGQLQVGGMLTAAGILVIATTNGFEPHEGDTFAIFQFSAAQGAFEFISLPGLMPGLTWDTGNLLTNGQIQVVAGEPPPPCVITCPSDMIVGVVSGQCDGAIVNYSPPLTSGNCPPVVCTPPSGSFFNAGATTVNCTTIGVTACEFTITVADVDPPTITCPADIVTNGPAGGVQVSFPMPAGSDNCGVASIVCMPPSGTVFPVGTNPVVCTVTDTAANTNACSFNIITILQEVPTGTNDLALTKMMVPKIITLKGPGALRTKFVKVTLQNRSPHDELITNLTGLVTLVAESLGTNCLNATVVLHNGPPNRPRTLKPKQKMVVTFDVTYNCANDPARGVGHEDFRYLATVHHEVIDGNADTHTGDDNCPRAALPGGMDNVAGLNIKDIGCHGGVDVKTDVFIR